MTALDTSLVRRVPRAVMPVPNDVTIDTHVRRTAQVAADDGCRSADVLAGFVRKSDPEVRKP